MVDLYVQDNDRGRVHPGLRKVPKLKYAKHIDLTSFSKMRADLAAQVSNIFACYILSCLYFICTIR